MTDMKPVVATPSLTFGQLVTELRDIEDVEFTEDGRAHRAVVENKLFLGSLSRVYLLLESGGASVRLYADISSRQALKLQIGQSVNVKLQTDHDRVFPVDVQ